MKYQLIIRYYTSTTRTGCPFPLCLDCSSFLVQQGQVMREEREKQHKVYLAVLNELQKERNEDRIEMEQAVCVL